MDCQNTVDDFWELQHYNETEKNKLFCTWDCHHTSSSGRTSFQIGNTSCCKAAFLYVREASGHKYNKAVLCPFSGHALQDNTSIRHDELVAWLHVWAQNNTDCNPINGKLHLHQWMSYEAIHAIYAEEMIMLGKSYLKYSQFCAIRRAELPGLVHMRDTVLARYEFSGEAVTSLYYSYEDRCSICANNLTERLDPRTSPESLTTQS